MINLKNLPPSPGVYIYRDKLGEIIYVGKAINLKKRVTQYFQRDDALGPKTATLVSKIDSIETRVVGSEIEALILESSLIKKHLPKYNSLMRDDRSYLYIVVTHDTLPIIYSTHKSDLPSNADIFGPFPSGRDVKSLLKTIRHIFPYYTKKHPKTDCLYCHLNLCPGPNTNQVLYKKTINKIKKILNGKFSLLRRQLVSEMNTYSKHQKYEQSLILKKQISSLDYVVDGWKNLSDLFKEINLDDDVSSKAVLELQTTLSSYLPVKKLNRIECFDISQFGTKYFVGSMTVAIDGKLDHSKYRQFKINTKYTADDQFMIREIVYRRLQHPEWGSPDLIVVDGGKPQVSSVSAITDIVIGLAKKYETIVIKKDEKYIEINLPANSSALNLLKNLRNEAHRFANRYRKTLMKTDLSLF
ncbi:MAG: GIY-YIG nuclease family protein [Candidatus Shapirobacteria bacterium]